MFNNGGEIYYAQYSSTAEVFSATFNSAEAVDSLVDSAPRVEGSRSTVKGDLSYFREGYIPCII